jgi:predicted nucleotidyltransferase
MASYKGRSELRKQVKNLFSKQAEIFQINFFGKEAEGKEDKYSDIDMIVCSSDLAKTQSNYRKIFNSISSIIGTLLLESTKKGLSEMLMLKDFSPYQKIDFSITSDISEKTDFGPFVPIYVDVGKQSRSKTKLKIVSADQVENQLNDFLFSVPRFTKCLFRQDFDMYRRWKGISDIVLVLLFEKYFGWKKETSKRKISAKEANQLFRNIDDQDRKMLKKVFPTDASLEIASSFQHCIDLLIDLSKLKAKHFKVGLNDEFISYIKSFLNSEVKRHHRKSN